MTGEAEELGRALDQDHAPETNGRTSVCRRCGSRTTGEQDERHVAVTSGAARVRHWLASQTVARQIAHFRAARDR